MAGCPPQSTEWSADLTPAVSGALDRLVDVVLGALGKWADRSAA
jgi:hypothetical protein